MLKASVATLICAQVL